MDAQSSLQSPTGSGTLDSGDSSSERTLVLAGGCFWCLDAWYRKVHGITSVESGYTGGGNAPADYYSVCSGGTGHAEAVKVSFDPAKISAETVMDMFFTMHNPTTLNRQGHDVGTQYRSALFATNDDDVKLFEQSIQRNQANWTDPIVTSIERLGPWYPAEVEHQDFYAQNPYAGYCQVIIDPKLAQTRARFSKFLQTSA